MAGNTTLDGVFAGFNLRKNEVRVVEVVEIFLVVVLENGIDC